MACDKDVPGQGPSGSATSNSKLHLLLLGTELQLASPLALLIKQGHHVLLASAQLRHGDASLACTSRRIGTVNIR